MKIKTKKQMTAEEYAKYMIDKHGVCGYESELIDSDIIDAPKRFAQKFELNPILKEDLPTGTYGNREFTIEVDEEITEDTKLDLIERFIGSTGNICYTSHTMSISKCLRTAPDTITTTHFYIENDDQELILIWRDGKLVE